MELAFLQVCLASARQWEMSWLRPLGFDPEGVPIFVAACPGAQPGLGSYCDRGLFVIPEPGTLMLLLAAAFAAAIGRRGRALSG